MAKKKTVKKSTSLKKYQGGNNKSEKVQKKTLYDKVNEVIDLRRFAAPIWGIGVGVFLFLLMYLINDWKYGLIIALPAAVLIGIAVHIINKD